MKRLSLTEGPILSSLFSLSVPIVLSNLLQSAYQITDTFWVGRLSAEAVAAVSISFPISFLLMAIGGGLPMAGAVLVSQYKGKGDDVAVNHTVAQTFLFIIGIAVLLTSIGYVSAEHIIRFMGAAPAVISDATLFLRVTFLGYLFVFMFFVFESLMRGFGEPKLPMKIVLATVLLNLVLDPLFIFGYGIIPPMGVAGAAMATFCTQALAALIGTLALLRGQYGMHIRLQDLRPDLLFFRQAFFLGLPSSIEQSTRALGMTVMTLLAASFGTMAVAAYGIGVRMLILVIIPALGLSIATSTFVGQNIGAGHIDRAERATRIGAGIGFLILSTCGVLLFFFARPLTLFFIPEGGEAVEMAVTFL
ncbi:MAG: MATE family efflux transporter, partial [Candidatus Peregrinibacteria bacterium]|nr:MATE family efflux transporter [Candidatus Peregrinibacteria bacterium]